MNSDGTKTIITERIDEFGNKVITKGKIVFFIIRNYPPGWDQNFSHGNNSCGWYKDNKGGKSRPQVFYSFSSLRGKKKLVGEKVIRIGADGKLEVEEYRIDENGNKIISNTKTIMGEDGVMMEVTETIGADGKKIQTIKKVIKNERGEDVEVTETIDENGNKVTKKVTKRIDEYGNEIIEEETIDANGNRIIKTKRINADGTITEEEIDPVTGRIHLFSLVCRGGGGWGSNF